MRKATNIFGVTLVDVVLELAFETVDNVDEPTSILEEDRLFVGRKRFACSDDVCRPK